MDIASVLVALISGLGSVSPIVYLSLIVTVGVAYFWFRALVSFDEERKIAATRYDEMVKAKDQRFDAHVAQTQTALDSANTQLATLNRDYAASNKDAGEIIARIAEALQTVANTLTGINMPAPTYDPAPRPRRRGRTD